MNDNKGGGDGRKEGWEEGKKRESQNKVKDEDQYSRLSSDLHAYMCSCSHPQTLETVCKSEIKDHCFHSSCFSPPGLLLSVWLSCKSKGSRASYGLIPSWEIVVKYSTTELYSQSSMMDPR